MDKSKLVHHTYVATHLLEDDGQFPNNQQFPLLVYKGALLLHPADEPSVISELFESHGWSNAWVDGIYDYHHYHSNTHEVLGIFCGTADVQLGGPEKGVCVELVRGDVVIIPAGVAHKCIKSSNDFVCVGAYADGSSYDILTGEPGDRPAADERIKTVGQPSSDPVYGSENGLNECWVNA